MKILPQLVSLTEQQVRLLRENLVIWLAPTILFGSLGTLYAVFKSSTWVATQGLLVRDEALDELSQSGRFNTNDARKAAQETITQVARNRHVVIGALEGMMSSEQRLRQELPAESAINDLLSGISVSAGKGAELGQSDVIYLRVKGKSAAEAVTLSQAVTEQLRIHLNELRNGRTRSVIQELTEKLRLTEANLSEATTRLQTIESQAGSDLGELRTLSQAGTGESNLRTSLTQIKNDLRNAKSTRTTQQEQLQFLLTAQQNPESILATPNRLLESQPSLKRLKDGLVDAQLRVSDLLGKMNSNHPHVRAAQLAEEEIRLNLHRELENAVRGVQADLDVTTALIKAHERQVADVQQRLNELAAMRAGYENLVADVQDRNAQVQETRRALAQARASLEASEKTSLITLVDRPDVGDGPVGPGRVMLLIASWIGGLSVGLGFFFLVTQSATPGSAEEPGRRWSDRVMVAGRMIGRRASDRTEASQVPPRGRRATDATPSPATEPPGSRRRAEDGPPAAPGEVSRLSNPPFPVIQTGFSHDGQLTEQ